MTLQIDSNAAETTKGVRVNVRSVAQVKVRAIKDGQHAPNYDQPSILLAAQHYLSDGEHKISDSVTRTLEGHQRQILGTLTVEELFKDRTAFAHRIQEVVVDDLHNMGFQLVSYVVTSIDDDDGYMSSLGRTQTAMVKREAQEGEALNVSAMEKKVAQYTSDATKDKARFNREAYVETKKDTELERMADRDLAVKSAEFDTEVRKAKEKAIAAGEIMKAQQQQVVSREVALQEKIKMEVAVEVAEQKALVEQRTKEGKAMAELINEKNKAEGVRVTALANAEKIRVIGEAEAAAIQAKGEADAMILQKKADAYKQYGEAALVQMIVEQLPDLASAIAKPLMNTEKMVFVSQDAAAGSMLTGDINRIISALPETVEGITGVDLRKLIGAKVAGV